MSYYKIPITGRLIDGLGNPLSGAQVFFTSKATTRGDENVPQTSTAIFSGDSSGYYSASVASGWYKIYLQERTALEPVKIGVASITGTGPYDLGTVIANSIPPPTLLESIFDVNTASRVNGSSLVWNQSRQQWIASGVSASADYVSGVGVNLSGNLSATGATLIARDTSISGVLDSKLTASGAALVARDSSISGALDSRLTATGAALMARDSTISGALQNQLSGLSYFLNSTVEKSSAFSVTSADNGKLFILAGTENEDGELITIPSPAPFQGFMVGFYYTDEGLPGYWIDENGYINNSPSSLELLVGLSNGDYQTITIWPWQEIVLSRPVFYTATPASSTSFGTSLGPNYEFYLYLNHTSAVSNYTINLSNGSACRAGCRFRLITKSAISSFTLSITGATYEIGSTPTALTAGQIVEFVCLDGNAWLRTQ